MIRNNYPQYIYIGWKKISLENIHNILFISAYFCFFILKILIVIHRGDENIIGVTVINRIICIPNIIQVGITLSLEPYFCCQVNNCHYPVP